jgi:hypothetical protein
MLFYFIKLYLTKVYIITLYFENILLNFCLVTIFVIVDFKSVRYI